MTRPCLRKFGSILIFWMNPWVCPPLSPRNLIQCTIRLELLQLFFKFCSSLAILLARADFISRCRAQSSLTVVDLGSRGFISGPLCST